MGSVSGLLEGSAVMRGLGFELRHELHLDRRVQRQLGDAYGRAGVQPGLSEDLAYKLGGPVDDLRLGVEACCRGDEAGHLHDAAYPVQAPGLGRGGGEGVQGAETVSPTLPVLRSSPFSKGSWPAVKIRAPARVAGT